MVRELNLYSCHCSWSSLEQLAIFHPSMIFGASRYAEKKIFLFVKIESGAWTEFTEQEECCTIFVSQVILKINSIYKGESFMISLLGFRWYPSSFHVSEHKKCLSFIFKRVQILVWERGYVLTSTHYSSCLDFQWAFAGDICILRQSKSFI